MVLTDKQNKVMESVRTTITHTQEHFTVTLGELINDYIPKSCVEPLFGQREKEDRLEEEEYNLGILKNMSIRKVIHLSDLFEIKQGYAEKVESATNDNLRKFYQRRVDKALEYILEGVETHTSDGQHRVGHYGFTFAWGSTNPIQLKESMIWTYDAEDHFGNIDEVSIDLKGKCMAKGYPNSLPTIIKERIHLFPTLLQITNTDDDELLSEMFFDDNNAERAPVTSRVLQLARSPLKSQLESLEFDTHKQSTHEFNFNDIEHMKGWTWGDFFRDRFYAGHTNAALYGKGAMGFQTFVLNAICRLYGDSLGTETAYTLQNQVVFGKTGFKICTPVLLDKMSELPESMFSELVEIFFGQTVAFDEILTYVNTYKGTHNFEGILTHARAVNNIMFAGYMINKTPFHVRDWSNLYRGWVRHDLQVYTDTKDELWTQRDFELELIEIDEIDTPRYRLDADNKPSRKKRTNQEKKEGKPGKLSYITRSSGYYHDCSVQTNVDCLGGRMTVIRRFINKNIPLWEELGYIEEISEPDQSIRTLKRKYEEQGGKCAFSQVSIDIEQLYTNEVFVDYEKNKTGLLVLRDSLQHASITQFLDV